MPCWRRVHSLPISLGHVGAAARQRQHLVSGDYPADLLDKKHIDWKIKLDGIGCSTPAVLQDRIFVTGPVDGHNGVIAFDWQGKEQWRTKLPPVNAAANITNGSAANSSPVADGNLLFGYFKSGELAAFDLSGKILWTTNLQERLPKTRSIGISARRPY